MSKEVKVQLYKEIVYFMDVDDISYRTDGMGNWEQLMGMSWEPIYDKIDELEKLLNQNKDE